MSLVDRVKNICLTPNTEWPVIAQEPASTAGLITGYVVPLAGIGAIAGFIGGSIVGRSGFFTGTYRLPMGTGIALAVYAFVGAIVGVLVLSFIINALAPTFGGEKNSERAMKVAVYSYTPAWIAAVLQIVPALGALAILGGLYGLYLLYLGLPVLMKNPVDKSVGYTAVTVVCAIVLSVVIFAVGGMIGIGSMGAAGMFGGTGGSSSPAADVQFDKDSPLGKLQDLGKAMEESGKKMEDAQKSGDSAAATAAAMETLGTLFGGGKRVDPLEIDQIKSFLPENVAGLAKQGSGRAEKTGMAGLMLSTAEATYSDGGSKRVTLEVSDPGGATGLMGLASWASLQTSKEDEYGTERTTRVNGRMVHEKDSKSGTDEYAIVIGERFVVSAKSGDVGLPQLRTIVSGLDLNRLESMKDVGVQKK